MTSLSEVNFSLSYLPWIIYLILATRLIDWYNFHLIKEDFFSFRHLNEKIFRFYSLQKVRKNIAKIKYKRYKYYLKTVDQKTNELI